MKSIGRLISICSLVVAGTIATPALAAEAVQGSGGGVATQVTERRSTEEIFARAIGEAQLRPEQKPQVDKLMAEGKERHAVVKKAKSDLALALADQIAAGKIDRCALGGEIKALAKAKVDVMPKDRESMEELHSILDPAQRGRFVDSLMQQKAEREKAHDTDAVVERMAKELNLNDTQKSSVREIVNGLKQVRDAEPAHKAHKERKERILMAFKGDKFDIDAVAPPSEVTLATVTERIEGKLWGAEAVLPVLTDEQRATLAKKIRDHVREEAATTATAAQDQAPPQAQDQASEEEED